MGFWKKAKTADTPGTWEGTEKYGPVKLASVDFRDGQQSVIATRMRTEDMLPVLEQMDNSDMSVSRCGAVRRLTPASGI